MLRTILRLPARRAAPAAILLVLAVLAAVTPQSALAQEDVGQAPPATLTYMNRPIVTFRATVGSMSPEQRVERAHRRIVELEAKILEQPVELAPVEIAGVHGVSLSVGGQFLFGVAPEDVNPDEIATVETLAADAQSRLSEALAARLEQERLPVLLRGIGLVLAATVVLALLAWLIWRVRLRIAERFHGLISEHMQKATARRFDWTRYGYALTARLAQLATTFAILLLAYVWLTFSLRQFPVTEPIGDRLREFLIGLIVSLGSGLAGAIPGIVTAIVILLIAQALVQVTVNVIGAAESGRVTLPIIRPDTASATKRILRVIIWGIGFAIAYPYIPGSDSAAFQGLSVFFGLMITLGSSGIVSQMMSGTVLIYSRALHVGEYVSTGEVEGVVTEMGAISTKLITPQNEEITIPNSVLVESTVKNSSRQFGGASALLSSKITIGYDTPWRQVHAMLMIAADLTPGLVKSPKPYVAQRALTDFYVEYELFALTDRPREQLAIRSALHAKIQDTFNANGVQIMSPQYYEQPPQPLIVPKEKWNAAATAPDQVPGADPSAAQSVLNAGPPA